MYNLSDGDMPPLDVFRVNLRKHDFRNFPSLNRKVLRELDELIAADIPALMGRVGGVSGVYSMSSMLEVEHSNTKQKILERKEQEAKSRKRRKSESKGSGGLTAFVVVSILFVVAAILGVTFVVLSLKGVVKVPALSKHIHLLGRKLLEGAAVGESNAENPAHDRGGDADL